MVLFSQVNPDSLPEKYVKKVIIDAKWGDGPWEFGMDTLSDPPAGPSEFILDKDENILIYDGTNGRIYKFNSEGKLIKEIDIKKDSIKVWSFTVKNDTLYILIFTGLSPVKKITMIDINTEKIIKTLEFSLPESDRTMNIKNKNGNIVLSIGKEEYKISHADSSGEIIRSSIINMQKSLPKPKFKRLTRTEGEYIVEGNKLLIPKISGNYLLNARLISKDKKGNFYIEVFSESLLKSSHPTVERIFKYSPKGKLLTYIEIPLENSIGGEIQISLEGDIYYLYPTGKIIEKDWKIHFIPGKVQVIKWSLQREGMRK